MIKIFQLIYSYAFYTYLLRNSLLLIIVWFNLKSISCLYMLSYVYLVYCMWVLHPWLDNAMKCIASNESNEEIVSVKSVEQKWCNQSRLIRNTNGKNKREMHKKEPTPLGTKMWKAMMPDVICMFNYGNDICI